MRKQLRRIEKIFSRVYKRLFLAEILVLGDSHAGVFRHRAFRKHYPKHYFNVIKVKGATASGLHNPNSVTQSHARFHEAIASSKAQSAFIILGEVDTGFVIWYRAKKYGESIDSMLDKAVANYADLLATMNRKFRVTCISAPLPTIRDGDPPGEVASARRDVVVSRADRTQLALKFNRRMQQVCESCGVAYLDLDQDSLGPDGMVKAELLSDNICNHHYDRDKYAQLIISRLPAL